MDINFICTKTTARYKQIIIDTLGTRVYVKPGTGTFYTWNTYMKKRAAIGDYMDFNRKYDSTILYNKPYDLTALPPADSALQVGLHYKNIDGYYFYPLMVQGYWMKMKIVDYKTTIGYCWIIWRNQKSWLVGFSFRA